jgi:RsiW-degrading membrane proteinase PrsW (M82 family)
MGQLFGAALIGFAFLSWYARNSSDCDALKAIILAFFIGDIIGFIIALIGQIGNVVNDLGWSTVIIYFLLALGFAYFQFKKVFKGKT